MKFLGLAVTLLFMLGDVEDTYIKEEYQEYVYEVAGEYELDPELIIAMMETESSGRRKVVSSAGCIGLMQVSPKWHKDRMERLGVTDLTDPYGNILVGCDFVAELFEKYGDVYAVLMAYNEGEYDGAIERAFAGQYSKYATTIVKRYKELLSLRKEKETENGIVQVY